LVLLFSIREQFKEKQRKEKKNAGNKPIADRSSLRPETASVGPFPLLRIQIVFQKDPLWYFQTASAFTLQS
jgi:hypothetical protein